MFNPPLNIGRRVLYGWVCVAAFGCGPEVSDCMDGFAADQQGRCVPVVGDAEDVATTAPTAPAVAVVPEHPRAGGVDALCTIVTDSVDVDGDPVVYRMQWVARGGSVVDGSRLSGSYPEPIRARSIPKFRACSRWSTCRR